MMCPHCRELVPEYDNRCPICKGVLRPELDRARVETRIGKRNSRKQSIVTPPPEPGNRTWSIPEEPKMTVGKAFKILLAICTVVFGIVEGIDRLKSPKSSSGNQGGYSVDVQHPGTGQGYNSYGNQGRYNNNPYNNSPYGNRTGTRNPYTLNPNRSRSNHLNPYGNQNRNNRGSAFSNPYRSSSPHAPRIPDPRPPDPRPRVPTPNTGPNNPWKRH